MCSHGHEPNDIEHVKLLVDFNLDKLYVTLVV